MNLSDEVLNNMAGRLRPIPGIDSSVLVVALPFSKRFIISQTFVNLLGGCARHCASNVPNRLQWLHPSDSLPMGPRNKASIS